MTHASVELIGAIAGVAPADGTGLGRACGARVLGAIAVYAWCYDGVGGPDTPLLQKREDNRDVTCPRCLVAMDAAREGRVLT